MTYPILLRVRFLLRITLTLTGRGERMRANGPVQRAVGQGATCHERCRPPTEWRDPPLTPERAHRPRTVQESSPGLNTRETRRYVPWSLKSLFDGQGGHRERVAHTAARRLPAAPGPRVPHRGSRRSGTSLHGTLPPENRSACSPQRRRWRFGDL